jgi:hypothetical protein
LPDEDEGSSDFLVAKILKTAVAWKASYVNANKRKKIPSKNEL